MAAVTSPPCASSAPRSLLASARSGCSASARSNAPRARGPPRSSRAACPGDRAWTRSGWPARRARMRPPRRAPRDPDRGARVRRASSCAAAAASRTCPGTARLATGVRPAAASIVVTSRRMRGNVQLVPIHLDDVARPIEQQGRGQTQVLPVHEQMPVQDRVAQAHFSARHHDRQRGPASPAPHAPARRACRPRSASAPTPAWVSARVPARERLERIDAAAHAGRPEEHDRRPPASAASDRICPPRSSREKSGAGKGS